MVPGSALTVVLPRPDPGEPDRERGTRSPVRLGLIDPRQVAAVRDQIRPGMAESAGLTDRE